MAKPKRILQFAVCMGMLTVFAGCASTPTHESTGQYVDDTGLTSKVKVAILKEPELSVMQIDVNTYRGVVQLSGFVDSEDQKSKAGQIASSVEGVKSVLNNLAVKPK